MCVCVRELGMELGVVTRIMCGIMDLVDLGTELGDVGKMFRD